MRFVTFAFIVSLFVLVGSASAAGSCPGGQCQLGVRVKAAAEAVAERPAGKAMKRLTARRPGRKAVKGVGKLIRRVGCRRR